MKNVNKIRRVEYAHEKKKQGMKKRRKYGKRMTKEKMGLKRGK